MRLKPLINTLMSHSRQQNRKFFLDLVGKTKILDERPENFSPCDAAILIYSFANLRIFEQNTWYRLQMLFLLRNKDMNTQDIVDSYWGMARYSEKNCKISPDVMFALNNSLKMNINQFNTRELSTLLFSLSILKPTASFSLVNSVVDVIVPRVESFSSMDVSLTIWAAGKLRIKNQNLWASLERKLAIVIPELSPKQVSNVVYGYASAPTQSIRIWQFIEEFIVVHSQELDNRSFANIIWAYAKKRQGSDSLWEKLESSCVDRLKNMHMLDLVNCIWGFHKVGRFTEKLKSELSSLILHKEGLLAKTELQDITQLGWVLYNEDIHDIQVWKLVLERFVTVLKGNSTRKNNTMLKAHKCFYIISPEIWTQCEEFYTDYTVNLCLQAKNGSGVEAHIVEDYVKFGHYCIQAKLGHKEIFWSSFLNGMKTFILPNVENNPELIPRMFLIIAMRFPDELEIYNQLDTAIQEADSTASTLSQQPESILMCINAALSMPRSPGLAHFLKNNYERVQRSLTGGDKSYLVEFSISAYLLLESKDDSRDTRTELRTLVQSFVDQLPSDDKIKLADESLTIIIHRLDPEQLSHRPTIHYPLLKQLQLLLANYKQNAGKDFSNELDTSDLNVRTLHD